MCVYIYISIFFFLIRNKLNKIPVKGGKEILPKKLQQRTPIPCQNIKRETINSLTSCNQVATKNDAIPQGLHSGNFFLENPSVAL